jgi:glycosyltransferase involved in cell wall biosynthesis
LANVNIIHCHDFDTLPIGYFLSKINGSRLIYDAHEEFSGMFSSNVPRIIHILVNSIERLLAKKAVMITVGLLLASKYEKLLGKKVQVIRNVPLRQIPNHKKQSNDVFRIGYVGGLLEDRCIIEMIQAFEEFSKGKPDVEFHIAGFGPLEQEVSSMASSSEAPIIFHGKIPYSDVQPLLSSLDLSAVLLSRRSINNYYSSPNKLFESCSVGTPVLASNFGELGWLVEHYSLGYTVDSDSPPKLLAALESIYLHRDKLESLRKEVQEVTSREFSLDSIKRDFLLIYKRNFLGAEKTL